MAILSRDTAKEHLAVLKNVFEKDHALFQYKRVFDVWYDFLSNKFSDDTFTEAIDNYIATSSYFPRSPKEIWDNWQQNQPEQSPPGERYNHLQLSSAEQNAARLTPKEMEENYLRMRLIIQLTMGKAQCMGEEEKQQLISKMRTMAIVDLQDFVSNY